MGYELHIARAEESSQNDDAQIPLAGNLGARVQGDEGELYE